MAKWAPSAGLESITQCVDCSPGRGSATGGLISNVQCTQTCGPGRFNPPGVSLADPNGCTKCSAGKYSNQTGIDSDVQCTGLCPGGRYVNIYTHIFSIIYDFRLFSYDTFVSFSILSYQKVRPVWRANERLEVRQVPEWEVEHFMGSQCCDPVLRGVLHGTSRGRTKRAHLRGTMR